MTTKTCVYCNNLFPSAELRPYAKNGGYTCFACASSTPERNAIAKATYRTLLEAAFATNPVAVVLTDDGPVPIDTVPSTMHIELVQ